MKKVSITLFLLIIIILLSAVSYADTDGSKNKQELTINIFRDPYSLYFQDSYFGAETRIYNYIMEGLTRSVSNGKVKPGIAEKWDISEDGLTYTFHLRDAKWTDGRPVTANDFKYGWMRAIDPTSESPYMTSYILNAEKYNNGKVTEDKVGIKVINEKTLEITLEQPVTYFDYLVSLPIFSPIRRDIYEKYGDDFNTEEEYFVTNGPYKVEIWLHDTMMVLTKNKDYWDASNIKLERVNALMIDDSKKEFIAYDKGILEHIIINDYDIKTKVAKDSINSYPDGTAWYILFNCKDSIMSNKNIRKALTLAIDRKALTTYSVSSIKPAQSLIPPEVIYDYDNKLFRDKVPTFFKDKDIDTAKKLLRQGLKELEINKLPKLKLMVHDLPDRISCGEAFIEMWKRNLDIDVELEIVGISAGFYKHNNQDYQFSFYGWGSEVPDAMEYLEIFVSSFIYNRSAYNNPNYDILIKDAKAESDKKRRSELLHDAEQVLMDDMPVGPIYFRYKDYAVKEYVKNFKMNAFGADIDFIYSYIEAE